MMLRVYISTCEYELIRDSGFLLYCVPDYSKTSTCYLIVDAKLQLLARYMCLVWSTMTDSYFVERPAVEYTYWLGLVEEIEKEGNTFFV